MDKQLRRDLFNAYLKLECKSEVPDTLEKLKDSGQQIAILSNGSPVMLEAVVKSSGLEDLVQIILSVDMAGIFKPDSAVYQLAVDHLGVTAAEIVFIWNFAVLHVFSLRIIVVQPEKNHYGNSNNSNINSNVQRQKRFVSVATDKTDFI